MNTRLLSLALVAASLSPLAVQAQQAIVPAQSEVAFTTRQMGVPVDGKFKSFSAQVAFDPAKLASSSIAFTVDTGSADISREANAEVAMRPAAAPNPAEHARKRRDVPAGRRASEQVGSVVLVAAIVAELAGASCIGAAGGVLDAAGSTLPANAAGLAAEHLIAAAAKVCPAGCAAPWEQPGFQVVLSGQVGRVAPCIVCAVPAVCQA